MKHLFQKTPFLQTIFFGALSILALPNLFIYWMLIDDGYDVFIVKKLTSLFINLDFAGMGQILVESQYGRFRPFYWIYNWLVYLIGGIDPGIHRLFHVFVYILISLVIFKISYSLTKSRAFSVIGSALFALSALNLENWIRLGPVEPILGLLLSLAFYFLIVPNNWKASVLFLFLSFLTKEISIAVIPAIALLFLGEKYLFKRSKESRNILYSLLSGIVFSAGVVLVTSLIRKGYGLNYEIEPSRIIGSIIAYLKLTQKGFTPFLEVSLLMFFISTGKDIIQSKIRRVRRTNFYGIIFLSAYISLIIILSPWPYTLERYMLPSLIFLSLFMSIYLHNFWIFLSRFLRGRIKLLASIALGIYFLYFCLLNSLTFWVTSQATVAYTGSIKEMTDYLAKTSWREGRVYLNAPRGEHTIELLYELDWHLDVFYGREDIKVVYLDDPSMIKKEDLVVSGDFLKQIDEETLFDTFGTPKKFSSVASSLVVTTPPQVIIQSLKKLKKFLLKGERITNEGIFTYHHDYYTWNVYEVK